MSYIPVPVPIPASIAARAYKSGTQTVGAVAKEWVSAPKVALLMAILVVLLKYPTPSKQLATKGGGAGVCQTKYCQEGAELWVLPPKQTLFKDQSLGVGLGRPARIPGKRAVSHKMESDAVREQTRAPGVRLVGAAVVENRVAV